MNLGERYRTIIWDGRETAGDHHEFTAQEVVTERELNLSTLQSGLRDCTSRNRNKTAEDQTQKCKSQHPSLHLFSASAPSLGNARMLQINKNCLNSVAVVGQSAWMTCRKAL
jgi:hypothetical protein